MVLPRHVGVFLESGRLDKFNGPCFNNIGHFHELARSGSWIKGGDRLKNFIAVFDRSRHDHFNKGSERGSRSLTSAVGQIRILGKKIRFHEILVVTKSISLMLRFYNNWLSDSKACYSDGVEKFCLSVCLCVRTTPTKRLVRSG